MSYSMINNNNPAANHICLLRLPSFTLFIFVHTAKCGRQTHAKTMTALLCFTCKRYKRFVLSVTLRLAWITLLVAWMRWYSVLLFDFCYAIFILSRGGFFLVCRLLTCSLVRKLFTHKIQNILAAMTIVLKNTEIWKSKT